MTEAYREVSSAREIAQELRTSGFLGVADSCDGTGESLDEKVLEAAGFEAFASFRTNRKKYRCASVWPAATLRFVSPVSTCTSWLPSHNFPAPTPSCLPLSGIAPSSTLVQIQLGAQCTLLYSSNVSIRCWGRIRMALVVLLALFPWLAIGETNDSLARPSVRRGLGSQGAELSSRIQASSAPNFSKLYGGD